MTARRAVSSAAQKAADQRTDLERRLQELCDTAAEGVPDGNTPPEAPAAEVRRLATVDTDVTLIDPDPEQPRRFAAPFSFSNPGSGVEDLAESIRVAGGLLQPVVVREHEARLRLIVGERRWRAYRLLRWTHIPAIRWTGPLTPAVILAIQVIENDQRQNLDPRARRDAYLRLQAECSGNATRAMKLAGISRTTWYRVTGQSAPETPSRPASHLRVSFGQITRVLASFDERIPRLDQQQADALELLLNQLLGKLRERATDRDQRT